MPACLQDKKLAELLNIPLLCPDPYVLQVPPTYLALSAFHQLAASWCRSYLSSTDPADTRLARSTGMLTYHRLSSCLWYHAPTPQEYSAKSGLKRAFAEASINIPLGAHDIYNEETLILALTKVQHHSLLANTRHCDCTPSRHRHLLT